MLEKKEFPKKENEEETPLCEVCGAVLMTAQERVSRRCAQCMSSQQT